MVVEMSDRLDLFDCVFRSEIDLFKPSVDNLVVMIEDRFFNKIRIYTIGGMFIVNIVVDLHRVIGYDFLLKFALYDLGQLYQSRKLSHSVIRLVLFHT